MFHDLICHVDRNGKPDADVATALGIDCSIDADQLAAQINQRAAGVSGVDRGIGLDQVFVPSDTESTARERAHDAGSDGLPEPEGIADRDNVVAHPQTFGIRGAQGNQGRAFDLDHRDIGLWIGADEFGLEFAPVNQSHRDLIRVCDHMIVSEYETAPRIDDYPRAQTLRLSFLRQIRDIKKASKERVIEQGVGLQLDVPLR